MIVYLERVKKSNQIYTLDPVITPLGTESIEMKNSYMELPNVMLSNKSMLQTKMYKTNLLD